MEKDLMNKVAIVTGGGRDIGRAVCVALGQRGASVAVNYRKSNDEAQATVKAVEKAGGKAIAVAADVTKRDDVSELVESTRSQLGAEIDILVNNAGGLIARKSLAEIDDEFWNAVMDVNLKSVLIVTQAVVPHMPDGGAIVNLSSLAARNGGGGGALAYSTSKGAVLTMTRALAKELGGRNIRVNCVSPGLIATTFHDTFTPDEARARVAGVTPLGREGTAEEVGEAVAFLASKQASFFTGESLEINGGLYFV